MILCHPEQMLLNRIASGFGLMASCQAKRCGRMYAKLINHKEPCEDAAATAHLKTDTWATYPTVRALFEELRCRASSLCPSCRCSELGRCTGTRQTEVTADAGQRAE